MLNSGLLVGLDLFDLRTLDAEPRHQALLVEEEHIDALLGFFCMALSLSQIARVKADRDHFWLKNHRNEPSSLAWGTKMVLSAFPPGFPSDEKRVNANIAPVPADE